MVMDIKEKQKISISIKVDKGILSKIDEAAKKHLMSRSSFMVFSSLNNAGNILDKNEN